MDFLQEILKEMGSSGSWNSCVQGWHEKRLRSLISLVLSRAVGAGHSSPSLVENQMRVTVLLQGVRASALTSGAGAGKQIIDRWTWPCLWAQVEGPQQPRSFQGFQLSNPSAEKESFYGNVYFYFLFLEINLCCWDIFPSLIRKASSSDTGFYTWFLIQSLAIPGPRCWKHFGYSKMWGPDEIVELTDILLLKRNSDNLNYLTLWAEESFWICNFSRWLCHHLGLRIGVIWVVCKHVNPALTDIYLSYDRLS